MVAGYANIRFIRLTARNVEDLLTVNTEDRDTIVKIVEGLRSASISTFVIRARNVMVLQSVFIRRLELIADVAEEARIARTENPRSTVLRVKVLVCVSIVVVKFIASFAKDRVFVLTTRFDINAKNAEVNDFVITARTKPIANLVEVLSFVKVLVVRLRNLRSSMDIVFNAI
jgi:hypothetical protein